MFAIYFGRYLLEKGELTEEQFCSMKDKVMDTDSYNVFVEKLLQVTAKSMEWLEAQIEAFQDEKGYLDQDMEALKSGDADRMVKVFMKLPFFSGIHYSFVASTLRNIMQFVDKDVMIGPVEQLASLGSVYVVKQNMYGDEQVFTCIAGAEAEFIWLASAFAEEEFSVIDPFSMDAIAELLNLSNGIFASELSESGIELDLYPPEIFPEIRAINTDAVVFLIPIYISGKRVNIVFSINADIDIV